MNKRLREPCRRISKPVADKCNPSIRPYNHPNAGMSFVGLLVEALVLRHLVFRVDHTMNMSI